MVKKKFGVRAYHAGAVLQRCVTVATVLKFAEDCGKHTGPSAVHWKTTCPVHKSRQPLLEFSINSVARYSFSNNAS